MELNDRIDESKDVNQLEALAEDIKLKKLSVVSELEKGFELFPTEEKSKQAYAKKLGELVNTLKFYQSSESYLNNKLHSIRQMVSIQTDYASYNKRV